MTGFIWLGHNRREAIRYLDDRGSRWRGFTGQWSKDRGYAACTVEFRGRDSVESARIGQRIEVTSDGHMRAVEVAHA
jgi:hypothetical protein